MMHPLRTALAAAVLGAFAFGVSAQTTAPAAEPAPAQPKATTEARESNQSTRIEEGKASGEINKREAKRLNMEQKGINKAQAHAEADGKVTKREQTRLDHLQNKASKDIHRQKNDKSKAEPAK